ncbi:MAG: PAS domain S-box protein [Rhodocyclaceae bacterium]|nr:PAS domain S-box protein [Rhodocyclaceae bacterium]
MSAVQLQPVRSFSSAFEAGNILPTGEEGLVALVLDGRGVIVECDPQGESLFGYPCADLVGQHVSLLIPELANLEFLQGGQPNSRLRYRSRIGYRFSVLRRNGERFAAILFLNCLESAREVRMSLIVRPA